MSLLTWETIDDFHQRAAVPGGWLVKAFENVHTSLGHLGSLPPKGYEWRVAMCFVPDGGHYWKSDRSKK